MLLVRTYLDKSSIHGLGVFADQVIRKGTRIWTFVEGIRPRLVAQAIRQAAEAGS